MNHRRLLRKLDKVRSNRKIKKIRFWSRTKCKMEWNFVPLGFADLETRVIGINPNSSLRETMLTTLHEIAHILLKHPACVLYTGKWYLQEVEAETLARNIYKTLGGRYKKTDQDLLSYWREQLTRKKIQAKPRWKLIDRLCKQLVQEINGTKRRSSN